MKYIDGIRKPKIQNGETYQITKWVKGLKNRGGKSSGHITLVVYTHNQPWKSYILTENI